MTEKRFRIDAEDFEIYGVLNKANKKENHKLIIHAHGLTGSIYEPSQHIMANNFPDKYGYDVARIELYNGYEKGRALHECTVKIHGQDLSSAAKHFRKTYPQIFGVGHSYGGPSLLMAEQKYFSALSLWDPTFPLDIAWTKRELTRYEDNYIEEGGQHVVIGAAMLQEGLHFNEENCVQLAEKIKTPVQVIHAANGILFKGRSYHNFSKGMTDHKIVKNTSHLFWEEGTIEPLLRHTRKWFDRF